MSTSNQEINPKCTHRRASLAKWKIQELLCITKQKWWGEEDEKKQDCEKNKMKENYNAKWSYERFRKELSNEISLLYPIPDYTCIYSCNKKVFCTHTITQQNSKSWNVCTHLLLWLDDYSFSPQSLSPRYLFTFSFL